MSIATVVMFVLLGLVALFLGLYTIGVVTLCAALVLFILDKRATPVYNALYKAQQTTDTSVKLVEHDAECTQPKLPV